MVKVIFCLCLVIFMASLEQVFARKRRPKPAVTRCEPKILRVPIERNGCRSRTYEEVKYCDGVCYSMTSYMPDYPYYKSHCHCCKASEEKVREVELVCPPDANGVEKTEKHFVPDIIKCKCKKCDGHK